MLGPEFFVAAAVKFAGGRAARYVRDASNHGKLESAYRQAAEQVVNHYETSGILRVLRNGTG